MPLWLFLRQVNTEKAFPRTNRVDFSLILSFGDGLYFDADNSHDWHCGVAVLKNLFSVVTTLLDKWVCAVLANFKSHHFSIDLHYATIGIGDVAFWELLGLVLSLVRGIPNHCLFCWLGAVHPTTTNARNMLSATNIDGRNATIKTEYYCVPCSAFYCIA